MAVTKTHPIKSTLKAAIDYILNPEKTDGKLLASSFGCGLETADIEFAWTREAAGDRGTHLGRHLIQSFAVGETTPEEAHKIGMELAGAVLGGKYEFVLTTHVDKDHLHNHLIFNAVSFVDYKKYHSNKQSYHFIRRTSDRICKEHGLSVVVPGQDKGKSYAEYTAEKQGTSYKAKLKTAIDTVIHGDIPHAVAGEEIFNQEAGLQVIPAQSGQVFRDHKVYLPALDGFQHPFQVGALHVQPRVAIVLIDCNNLPSLLFAVGFQHSPLVCDTGALPVKVIVLGKPAIDSRPEAACQYHVHACIFKSVHHNRYPHNPDGTRSL